MRRCSARSAAPGSPQPTALPVPAASAAPKPTAPPLPEESHFADLRQLTFGGENAEAYWSFDGTQLTLAGARTDGGLRSHLPPARSPTACPSFSCRCRAARARRPARTSCPAISEVIYASTHLGGDACPPRPDHSQGYVWALYDTYDIFRANADGIGRRAPHDTPGLRRRGDGVRQGRLDRLHVGARRRHRPLPHGRRRQERQAPHARRRATTAARSSTPTARKIVWRASRPKPGKELDDYKQPARRRTWCGRASSSSTSRTPTASTRTQITYLDAASFGAVLAPGAEAHHLLVELRRSARARVRPLGDRRRRHAPRAHHRTRRASTASRCSRPTASGWRSRRTARRRPAQHDTNVFVARWKPTTPAGRRRRRRRPIASCATSAGSPIRRARAAASAPPGLDAAGAYIEERFKDARPRARPATTAVTGRRSRSSPASTSTPATPLKIGGAAVPRDAFEPLGFSASGEGDGPIWCSRATASSTRSSGVDDYAKLDVNGKIVVVRRFVPEARQLTDAERSGALRRPAPQGLDWRASTGRRRSRRRLHRCVPKDAPATGSAGRGAAAAARSRAATATRGIPVLVVKRAALAAVLSSSWQKKQRDAPPSSEVALSHTTKQALQRGRPPARRARREAQRRPGVVVRRRALRSPGLGGTHSLAPDSHVPHLGADDNASGTATLLEIARAARGEAGASCARDVVFVAVLGRGGGRARLDALHAHADAPG